MIVIIAGSRTLKCSPDEMMLSIGAAVEASGFQIDKILSGGAEGVDTGAIVYAQRMKIPCGVRRPKYNPLQPPGHRCNKLAPKLRNQEMVDEAKAGPTGGALIAVWDGMSGGTADVVCRAVVAGLPVFVKVVG